MGTQIFLSVAGVAVLLLGIVVRRWDMSRLAKVEIAAAPTHGELGPEPPAVVAVLAHRFSPEGDDAAIAATFVDLVDRDLLRLTDHGDDLTDTYVRLGAPAPTPLMPYEEMIIDRVKEAIQRAGTDAVPLTALRPRDDGSDSHEEWLSMHAYAIQYHSRLLGLSWSLINARGTPAFWATIGLISMAPVLAFCTGWFWVIAPVVMLSTLYVWLLFLWLKATDTYTPHGRRVTAFWLGLRNHLLEYPSFATLPPASVVLWNRYLSYAVALDAAPHTSAILKRVLGSSAAEKPAE